MSFVRHEACPRCQEQGKDASGNNLARYSNGSAWCFACKYMEKPTAYQPKQERKPTLPPADLSTHFHEDNLKWLTKYLKPCEIMDHFRYSPGLHRHVYQSGEYWEARSVKPGVVPKCLSHGPKPFVVLGEGEKICLVEDVVSAIKVARVCTAVPLFGAHVPSEWMIKIAKMHPKEVVFWLDRDKQIEGREFAKKFNLLAPVGRSLTTLLDPKAYDEEDIKRFMGIE